jgi:hypothetical protein
VFVVWANTSPDPSALRQENREQRQPGLSVIADANKVWLAVVDLTQRKVAVTQVFQGATSVGGEVETLDCR